MKYVTHLGISVILFCCAAVLYTYTRTAEGPLKVSPEPDICFQAVPRQHQDARSEKVARFNDRAATAPFHSMSLKRFQHTDFYRTIISKNLFRPLGWRAAPQSERYRLLGTLVSGASDGQWVAKAVFSVDGELRILGIDDALDAQTRVLGIDRHSVVLERDGQEWVVELPTGDVFLTVKKK